MVGFLLAANVGSVPWLAGAAPVASVETNGRGALHEIGVSVTLPYGATLERVDFLLGFASDEVLQANRFLDALSLTVAPIGSAGAGSTLLLTTDVGGTLWFPEQDPSAVWTSESLSWSVGVFPPELGGGWTTRLALSISLAIPKAAQPCGAQLTLALFDNGLEGESFGFVQDLRAKAAADYFLLESSAAVEGPYSVEMGVEHRGSEHQMSLRYGGDARFYRLRADSAVSLRLLNPSAEEWLFAYEFPEPRPMLEVASSVAGPFQGVTNHVFDSGARRFRVPATALGSSMGFFRIRATVRTWVTSVARFQDHFDVAFEYRPQVFALQSSAQPCGPFADDAGARFDTSRQWVSVSRSHPLRFFRLAHSDDQRSARVTDLGTQAGRWEIRYNWSDHPGGNRP